MTSEGYLIKFYGGPKDGDVSTLFTGYPPNELEGYTLSRSVRGKFFIYSWNK
jgi:hypothetical protein